MAISTDNVIRFTKGNTSGFRYKFNLNIDGTQIPVPVGNDDQLIFSVKKTSNDSDSNIIFSKTKSDMTYENGTYFIPIEADDTKNIALGTNDTLTLYWDVKFKGFYNNKLQEQTLTKGIILLEYNITR